MSKYRARKTVCHFGHKHDSSLEAKRCEHLHCSMALGDIRDLEQQPAFDLHASTPDGRTVKIGTYKADFAYLVGDARVIEDVKGVRTALYRRSKKHVEAQYGISISEYPPKPLQRRKARRRVYA